jgi:HSP20 family molecular chaperone IbpA
VDGDALTISVENSCTHEESNPDPSAAEKTDEKETRVLHRQERIHEYDNRVIRMPDSADLERVEAQSTDGVLTVIIPKKDSSLTNRRTIPVV